MESVDSTGEERSNNNDNTKVKMKKVINTKTTNINLQLQLESWVLAILRCLQLPNPSSQRNNAIDSFCRSFVPHDVTEDDIQHFSGSLCNDEVYKSHCCIP